MAWYDVVIVGGGVGGMAAARELDRLLAHRPERVLLVAQENFMLFSPLLPEAASGTLEPRHAVVPLRELLRRIDVMVGDVAELDVASRRAVVVDPIGERHVVEFDSLVLSPGSVPVTLPIPGLGRHAVGFKSLPDAIWLRNRVLAQLEAAQVTEDLERRRALLTFTFVGGGYAGVEALAELESLARDAMRNYPRLRPQDMRWVLVEAQPSLLPGLDHRLAAYTLKRLHRRAIEVHLSTRLESCEDAVVHLSGGRVAPYRSDTIVWTAGQRPSPFVAQLGLPLDSRGRVTVDEYLEVAGHRRVYAVGDAAAVPDPDGGTNPATAQHALRQGRTAGINVAAAFGVGQRKRFTYRNRGLAVTLGRWDGTAQVKRYTFTGFGAWWMGRSYHLLMMPGLSRKLRVVSDWTLALVFRRDVAQLGSLGSPRPLEPGR